MTRDTHPPPPHTLEGLAERWSYEARRLEQIARFDANDAAEVIARAEVYRMCAFELRRLLRADSLPPGPPLLDLQGEGDDPNDDNHDPEAA